MIPETLNVTHKLSESEEDTEDNLQAASMQQYYNDKFQQTKHFKERSDLCRKTYELIQK